MTLSEAIRLARETLAGLETPRLEAERLVAHATGSTISALILHEDDEFSPEREQWLRKALDRRLTGEPLAYILESAGFYKSDFFVTPGVLVPRPETEAIVTRALQLFAGDSPAAFVDLGCGSGCIGLSLLQEWPRSRLLAVDQSAIAIQVCRENARRMRLGDRCELYHCDVAEFTPAERLRLVVANPPYIGHRDQRVQPEVRRFEPAEALFADDDGFAIVFAWSAWTFKYLCPGGWWIVEIGAGQNEAVKAKLLELGFCDVELIKDLAGHWRTVAARRP